MNCVLVNFLCLWDGVQFVGFFSISAIYWCVCFSHTFYTYFLNVVVIKYNLFKCAVIIWQA
jgi:hypothetical protein